MRAILLSTIANIAAHSRAKIASSTRSIRETVARVARPGLPGFKAAALCALPPFKTVQRTTDLRTVCGANLYVNSGKTAPAAGRAHH